MRLQKSAAAAEAAIARNQARPAAPLAAPSARQYLTATYQEKDQVKALGAQFDITRRAWYVEAGKDLTPFSPWIKK